MKNGAGYPEWRRKDPTKAWLSLYAAGILLNAILWGLIIFSASNFG